MEVTEQTNEKKGNACETNILRYWSHLEAIRKRPLTLSATCTKTLLLSIWCTTRRCYKYLPKQFPIWYVILICFHKSNVRRLLILFCIFILIANNVVTCTLIKKVFEINRLIEVEFNFNKTRIAITKTKHQMKIHCKK